jgi:hypothetical protein
MVSPGLQYCGEGSGEILGNLSGPGGLEAEATRKRERYSFLLRLSCSLHLIRSKWPLPNSGPMSVAAPRTSDALWNAMVTSALSAQGKTAKISDGVAAKAGCALEPHLG